MQEEKSRCIALKGDGDKTRYKRSLKVYYTGINCRLVYEILKENGVRFITEGDDWMLAWTNYSLSKKILPGMRPYQKINHFPGMNEICRKDLLARNLSQMAELLPESFDFFPRTWCLPRQIKAVQSYVEKAKKKVLIVKPTAGSQGKGIFLSLGVNNRMKIENAVCQPYITNPLLIDGFKFDLRFYAVVTSVDPLRMYVYNDGIARFATTPYEEPNKGNINNRCMHLTNYAVNKDSDTFNNDKDCGSKRSLRNIEKYMASIGYPVTFLRKRIDQVVVKTMLSVLSQVQHEYHIAFPSNPAVCPCFQILGFDILLTRFLYPKLIEVNLSPSLGTHTQVDHDVKRKFLTDVLELANISQELSESLKWEDRRKMLTRTIKSATTLSSRNMTNKEHTLHNDQFKHEDECIGNFRRVYPTNDCDYSAILEKTNSKYSLSIPKRTSSQQSNASKASLTSSVKSNSSNKSSKSGKTKPSRGRKKKRDCSTPFWGVQYIS